MSLIEFCGEQIPLTPDQPVRFGRAGDLVLDDNPFLHRHLGCVEFRDGVWWLGNTGSRIPLVIKDLTSRTQVQLAPGREMALTFPVAVQFTAGRFNYEFEILLAETDPGPTTGDAEGEETISLADLPMTDDQRRLVLALAERTLLNGDAVPDLPTNRAAAHRLGWTITRFNRKLDNVCDRLTRAGLPGLRGNLGALANDRRSNLVEHAVTSGLVTFDDLSLLDRGSEVPVSPGTPQHPRPCSEG